MRLAPRLDLGPNQLKWLRKNVVNFGEYKGMTLDQALALFQPEAPATPLAGPPAALRARSVSPSEPSQGAESVLCKPACFRCLGWLGSLNVAQACCAAGRHAGSITIASYACPDFSMNPARADLPDRCGCGQPMSREVVGVASPLWFGRKRWPGSCDLCVADNLDALR